MPKDEFAVSGDTTQEELASFADELRSSQRNEPPPADLPSDDLDAKPDLGEEKPAATAAEKKEVQAEPAPKQPTTPAEKMYTLPNSELYGDLRGKKVSLKQLEESGLLEKMVTRDHQEMHNTKLYQDLRKEMEDQVAQRVQQILKDSGVPVKDPNAPPPVDQKVYGDAVEAHYVPQLKQLAEQGAFEADFVEAYPRAVAQIEHRFRSGAVALETLAQQINKVSEWVGMKQSEEVTSQGQNIVETRITEAANGDEKLVWLRDPEHRRAFIEWAVSDDNPYPYKDMRVSTITPKVVTAAFLAYVNDNPDVIAAAASQPPARRPNMATAGAGTSGARSKGKPNEIEELMEGYSEALRARRSGVAG